MGTRIELQKDLEDLLGTRNVYFQPPASVKLNYPCIIYELSNEFVAHADDKRYARKKMYDVTIIDKNPDTKIPDEMADRFEYCSLNRFFTSDNLNHYVYQLYY